MSSGPFSHDAAHIVSLTSSDGEVYEKGEGTLRDSYSKRHASNYVIFGQN